MGGAGAIAASANVCTKRFVAMIDAALCGDVPTARQHAEALLPLVLALFAEPSPAIVKALLHAEGHIPTPAVRMPLAPASSAGMRAAHAALEAASDA
jgi:4-hydroxy-tetrahydrodipicolinate synthase